MNRRGDLTSRRERKHGAQRAIQRSARARRPRCVAPVQITGRSVIPSAHAGPGARSSLGQRFLPSALVRRRLLGSALPFALFILALTQCLNNETSTPFHPDEARWLNRAHFITDLKEPFGPTWSDYYITRGQPPLGSYLMGIGILAQGRDTATNAVWDFGYDADWNSFNEAFPESGDLLAGRRTNAFVAALVVVAVYLLGARVAGRFGAFMGGLFLSLHPLHIYLGSQALSDQLLSLTLALAFLAAFWFGKRPGVGRAVLLGVLLGLGGATKLSPLLLSVPLAVVGATSIALQIRYHGRKFWNRPNSRVGILLLFQPVIAFASLVAVSPYLWPSPIRRTFYLFEFRRIEMVGQGTNWPSVAVASPTAAMSRIGLRLNDGASTTVRLQELFGELTSINFQPIGFDLLMVSAGGLLFVVMVINKGVLSPHGLVGVLLGSELALIVLGLGSDFYRYYLPIVFISAVLVTVFGDALWKLLSHQVARSWRGMNPKVTLSAANDRSREDASPSTSEGT